MNARDEIEYSGVGHAGRGGAVEAERRQDQAEPCDSALPTSRQTVAQAITTYILGGGSWDETLLADAVLAALEAAGFTIAPTGAWAALRVRLQERLVMAREVLDEQGYADVAALVPLEEVLIWMDELGDSGRLVQAGWEYRDPAWPEWRWHLSLDEPVAWETRHPVYRIEGDD